MVIRMHKFNNCDMWCRRYYMGETRHYVKFRSGKHNTDYISRDLLLCFPPTPVGHMKIRRVTTIVIRLQWCLPSFSSSSSGSWFLACLLLDASWPFAVQSRGKLRLSLMNKKLLALLHWSFLKIKFQECTRVSILF